VDITPQPSSEDRRTFPTWWGNGYRGSLVGTALEYRILGQSFFVENKAGAGNMIGINAVAKSPADGYTLLFVPSTLVLNTVLYKNIRF
jgi:tripartite-type tricarboxylate transporter receptor subunit TctC